MAKKLLLILFIFILFPALCFVKREYPENSYRESWCAGNKGVAEVIMPDKTRCDCITETHAVEFDFAEKWTEAIGKSLHYALQTGKRAGIVLILENAGDRKFWIRLNSNIEHFKLPIDTWGIGKSSYLMNY